jgi:hypothetical protein
MDLGAVADLLQRFDEGLGKKFTCRTLQLSRRVIAADCDMIVFVALEIRGKLLDLADTETAAPGSV